MIYNCRLKQQLVTSQEEEEEQLRWRVDAEVRVAVQEAQAALQSELASRDDRIAALEVLLQPAGPFRLLSALPPVLVAVPLHVLHILAPCSRFPYFLEGQAYCLCEY